MKHIIIQLLMSRRTGFEPVTSARPMRCSCSILSYLNPHNLQVGCQLPNSFVGRRLSTEEIFHDLNIFQVPGFSLFRHS